MAVQTSYALEDQVDRREIGDEQVEVDVEGLLDDLSGHDDGPVRAPPGLAQRTEAVEEVLVLGEPVADGEAGVVETDVLAETLAQRLIGLLRASHRIADHQCAAAVGEGLLQERDQGVLREPSEADRAAPSRRRGDDLGTILTSGDQAGEGSVQHSQGRDGGETFSRRQAQAPPVAST